MFSSFGALVEYSILFAVAFIFIIAGAAFAINVGSRAFSSGVVQIGSFPDLSDPAKDRGPYLVARAQELSQPVTLDALYEVKVPPLTTRFGAKDDLKFLDDVKINIQGVDLPSVLRNLFAALPANQPVVSATPEPAGAGGSAARLEWKKPSGERRSWLLLSKLPANDANATKQIIDQAIYTMVFYIHYDPAGPEGPQKSVQFSSTRALEAYYAGQQHLSAYQRGRPIKQAELDDAEQDFRTLYREMPQFVDGLMLLGITLSEKRSDTEALIIFERVEHLLRQKPQLEADDKKVLFQAMLLHATALRKLYEWQTNHEALNRLKELKEQITPLLPTPPNAAETTDKSDYLKIYISTLIEEAYALGVNLILLNESNFIEALTKNSTLQSPDKDTLEDIQTDLTSGDQLKIAAAKQNLGAAFQTEIQRIYLAHRDVVSETVIRINQIDAKDSSAERVQARFLSDLHNAEAYAQYRRAQALEEDDQKFFKECEIARSKLHEAYAVHQNEYSILLNLGLVYGDPRCDPDDKYIEFAREFFRQSIEIKPLDYYGHQQLAGLAIRQAYTWGLEFTKPDIISEAIKSADTARELRPGSGTVFALLAQGYILQWAKTSDEHLHKELEPLIETALIQAARGKATPTHQATAQTQWLLQQSRRATDDQFKVLKPQLAAALDKAIEVAAVDRTWYGRKLVKDATKLKKALSDLEDKKQSTLRWPS
jgi:hypothetical protein